MIGSSDHMQQGDLEHRESERRYPNMFVHGSFNEYGYDSGLNNAFEQSPNGSSISCTFICILWCQGNIELTFLALQRDDLPTEFQANVWGVTPAGKPDLTRAFGDVDNDTVLDLLSPVSLLKNVVWLEQYPPSPHLAYRILINDATMRYSLVPTGSQTVQILIYVLLAAIPVLAAVIGVWAYRRSFYAVKFNRLGQTEKHDIYPSALARAIRDNRFVPDRFQTILDKLEGRLSSKAPGKGNEKQMGTLAQRQPRRTVLIATMEYDIEDWEIKIKIGGLGVMAQLMSKHLQHLDLVWVVPCVGGIDYPIDQRAKPMTVKILDVEYTISVQYHHVRPNITYVLLDSEVFRRQTAKEPYPRRMDDMESAIYYSAWNSCIAEAMRRFPIDLYHINDYHGAVAPLHLLPRTIPCCLSLHNAEFQGMSNSLFLFYR